MSSIRDVVLAWTATWSAAGASAAVLTANADLPHLPRFLGPVLLGVTGAVAGSFAWLIFLLLRRLPGGAAFPARWRTVALAAAAGALAMLILAPVIGVPRPTACAVGVAAGALSGFLSSHGAAARDISP